MDVYQILAKLVSFPVLGGESNMSIINWISSYLDDLGIAITLVPNEERNKASLHCRIGPPVDGGVILSGHSDVVPVEGQDWNTDPFQLADPGDGKLYGRGSCDMKGFLACFLALAPEMRKHPLKKPIYFAISYDEEVGCLAAPALAQDIIDSYEEKARFAIIGEPSLMQPTVGQKGICVLKTIVNGSAGHSSRIRQEVSAIHESARLILWLESYMDKLIAKGNIDPRFDPPYSSIHVGKIKGGVAHNIVADHASFLCDIRTIPQDSLQEIRNEFAAYCREREQELRSIFPEFQIITEAYHPPVPALDTHEDQDIVGLVKRISGNDQLMAVSYAAEAGQFAEAGFESIICGPGSIEQAHRANEFIAKSELDKGVSMLRNLLTELS